MAINEKLLHKLISQISALAQNVADIKTVQAEPLRPVYNNEEIMTLLGIGKDLLQHYRNSGLIGYSKCGDKYWYTSDDVIDFLKKHHQKLTNYRRYGD